MTSFQTLFSYPTRSNNKMVRDDELLVPSQGALTFVAFKGALKLLVEAPRED